MTDSGNPSSNALAPPTDEPTAPAPLKPLPLPDGFAFSGAPEPGYVTDFGSSLRSSRVQGVPRQFQAFRRIAVAPFAHSGTLPSEAKLFPRMIMVSPDTQHVVVDWDKVVEYRDADGNVLAAHGKSAGDLFYVRDAGPYSMGDRLTWTGQRAPGARSFHGISPNLGHLSSLRIGRDRRFAIGQGGQLSDTPTDLSTIVSSEKFLDDNQQARKVLFSPAIPCFQFAYGIDWPRSSSTIDDGFWAVLALRHGELRVFSGDGVGDGVHSAFAGSFAVDYHIADVSIVPPGIAVVEEAAPEPPRFHVELVARDVPATTVHYLNAQGRELWKVTVPFGLGQPPIDCGNGRVCLAGFGLASVREGQIEWSTKAQPLAPQPTWPAPSTGFSPPAPVRVTAFQEGSLAVAERDTLRIVAPDGSIKQEFKVERDELITTPHAPRHRARRHGLGRHATGAVPVAVTKREASPSAAL